MLQIAILAGGLATRMLPATAAIPKAMLPVEGAPLISHQLRLLYRHGLRRVVLCLGHLGEQVAAFVRGGERFGLRVTYSYDGPALLGTGGALRKALPFLDERFFVLYDDSYLPCNFRAVEERFDKADASVLMTVYHNDNRWVRSNVEFKDGKILAYDKANPSEAMHHVDYGLGVFFKNTIALALETGSLEAVYQQQIPNGLAGMEMPGRFYEIGSPEGLKDLEKFLRKKEA